MDFPEYRDCHLCPRDCGVGRAAGATGVCGETAVCRVASIGAHFGEEPSFSGTRGSGTIFFGGCSCGCFFCQNHQISTGHAGEAIEPDALFARVRTMIETGVHNVNFVTPDHFWPHIAALCRRLREDGVQVPFLWNGSGYHRADRVAEYAEWIELFMPDFKFSEPELARVCMGDAAYPRIALAAIDAMIGARGFLEPWDPTGAVPARQGVLVRHLVLPGEIDNSVHALRELRRAFGRNLPLSVMSQFHPVPACRARGRLTRRVTAEEYARVCDVVAECEFKHVYVQELLGDDAFLPDFERMEPFAGNTERGRPGSA